MSCLFHEPAGEQTVPPSRDLEERWFSRDWRDALGATKPVERRALYHARAPRGCAVGHVTCWVELVRAADAAWQPPPSRLAPPPRGKHEVGGTRGRGGAHDFMSW